MTDVNVTSAETTVLIMDEPMSEQTEAAQASVQSSSENSAASNPESSSAPQDTLFRNLPIPVPVLPSTSRSSPQNLSLATGTIEKDDSRVAVRFLVKKSKHFCGAISFYLSKSAAANSSKFKSLMSTLKDSVKNTLASGMPSSETINSLVNTFKGHQLPNCLRFLSFSLKSIKSRNKRIRSQEKSDKPSSSSSSSRKSNTFLNSWKKPEPESEGAHQFAKPKIYECSYCETKFFKLPVYLKHIRRHTQLIRCENCSKVFTTLINKRRHQIQCSHRAIL